MQIKEEKICSLTQKGTRLQLIRIIEKDDKSYYYTKNIETGYNTKRIDGYKVKYQIRLNRKIVSSSISEYNERKVFATYVQNIILQLKIY